MNNPIKPSQPTPRDFLGDEIVNDLLDTSDHELLTESGASESARQIRAAKDAFERAKIAVGKRKWAAVKAAALARAKSTKLRDISCLDVASIRARVEALAKENPVMREKLTLAARNGQEWSDQTVLEIWKELLELGAVSDD
jgi:hypothetical protein